MRLKRKSKLRVIIITLVAIASLSIMSIKPVSGFYYPCYILVYECPEGGSIIFCLDGLGGPLRCSDCNTMLDPC